MRVAPALAVVAAMALPAPSIAQDFEFYAFGDARVVAPPDERSVRDGGLGKARYGGGDVSPELGEISAIGRAQLLPELSTYAHVRYEPTQQHMLDLVEGYARYRPVSTTPLRGSVKMGAFFPPISLENEGIGWTSLWTLTPSAINSWVGDELRTIGGEGQLEWRGVEYQIEATAALFAANDPAGVLLADRGWSFNDRPAGLFDHNRLPDVGAFAGQATPIFSQPFREIDGRVGWYVGLSGRWLEDTHVAVLYYDNDANPSAFEAGQFAWRTKFWSLGAETRIDAWVLKSQVMVGSTVIAPRGMGFRTDFEAAYVLVGREFGKWRLAARGDQFSTNGYVRTADLGENGYAATLALTWRPLDWLRITTEFLHIDSTREQRVLEGLSARTPDNQLQVAFRLIY